MKNRQVLASFALVVLVAALLAATTPMGNQPQIQQDALTQDVPVMTENLVESLDGISVNPMTGEDLSFTEKVLVKQVAKKAEEGAGGKSQIVALILAIVVGGLGVHRFYLGYIGAGVIQLLTAGGCGIWSLIDIIRIAMGTLKPKGAEYAKTF